MSTRIRLAALMLIALAYGLAYVLIVPAWQAPDEPMLYEYAALVAELGRVPRVEDRSQALEQRLADSLAQQRFWHYRVGQAPAAPPRTIDGVMALFPMPRQVGGDPPLYFALAALPLRLASGWPPERQVMLLRLLNVLLLPCTVACAYGAARELCATDHRPPTTDHRPPTTDTRPETRDQRHETRDQRTQNSKLKTQNSELSSHSLTVSSCHFVILSSCHVPLAVAALVAFHPMLAVIGASLSNDGLASFLGAALCWATLRLVRRGANIRGVALAAGLLGLGLLTKRTMLPYLPLLLALGLGWALVRRRPTTGPTTDDRQPTTDGRAESRDSLSSTQTTDDRRPTTDGRAESRDSLSSILYPLSSVQRFSGSPRRHPVQRFSVLIILLALLWVGRQFDYQHAARWMRYGSWEASARVWPAEPPLQSQGAARRLAAGEMDIQPLPAVGADLLRGRTIRFGARIWSDAPARGRLIVYTGDARREWSFEVDGTLSPEVAALVAQNAHGVWVGVAADSGWFYADDLWAAEQDRPNNLLMNGGSELPALVVGSPLWPAARYMRLPELAWALASGHIADPLPYGGDWANLFFASFWGHFGWMDVSFVQGSLWMQLLTLVCLAGGLGLLRWLLWRRGPPWQRRQLWLLIVLVLVAAGLPIANAYTMPMREALQQGRYLFPALVPIAILVALGQSALVPARWQRRWLWLWLGFWLAFSLAALLRLWAYYQG